MEVGQKDVYVYHLTNDIKVISITASSFPEGIFGAFQTLHKLLPTTNGREFFGVSRPNEEGTITYKAAVEEAYTGEAEKYGCETFVIPKGEYLGKMVTQFRKDEFMIPKTFKTLLSDPRIDAKGFCLEVYLSDEDVMCLVRLEAGSSMQDTGFSFYSKPDLR